MSNFSGSGGAPPAGYQQQQGAPAQTFPCKKCGAQMNYDAATRGMACPYCGYKEAIAQQAPAQAPGGGVGAGVVMQALAGGQVSASGIRDIPIEQGMQMAQRGLGAQVTTIQCKDCGATVNVGEGERTTACAFCGSKQVLNQATNESAIRPESMVPFAISKQDANKRFADWLGSLWFRPNDLKKIAKVQEMGGVYVPFWVFASNVFSQWTAERGWYYYVDETYSTVENGQRVTRTRRVQHTRWEPAFGQRSDRYEDILVCAGRGLPQDLVDKLSSFNCKQLVPYAPSYLAGWRAESYSLDLMPGWSEGQNKIATQQNGRCSRDIGGDTHRNLSVANQFSNTTFKHVLLPIWIAAYRYNNKVFRFLVNGQSGEVVGKAPWSFWKIALLCLALAIVIGVVVAIVLSQQQQ
jgi:DNA-directed RNA polymerase subunit RPC12/RpoP